MIDCGMQSAIGIRHEVNEDSLGHAAASRLWLVADGMGGHAAGDVASAIVRDRIQQEVTGGAELSAAISAAHLAVAAAAQDDPQRQGMGSTVVAVRLRNGSADVAWVGDSRAYLVRAGSIRQLTRDHTLVQWLLDRGDLTPEQAANYPSKNVLVRTLGLEQPTVDETRVGLERGDQLLLCSDGVTGELTDAEICDILVTAADAQNAADQLVDAVVTRRGKDDASAIVIRILERDKLRTRGWVPVVGGMGLGLLVFLIWNWMKAS
jgi:PPM family protein phosphatase